MCTQALLEAITATVPLSEPVAEAFRQVDRAVFVPEYYRHQGAAWTLEASDHVVYEDRALTTQVTHGLASSSSSQPSIMAAMLAALDVQPGDRVLEIGTGTGYNAALLAHLVGARGQVISLELDEGLIRRAQQQIQRAGFAERVTVVRADGREGDALGFPFDRIIITAGFRHLESAWEKQLRPGGVLVGNLRGNITGVLLKLQKHEHTQMIGHLLPYAASFMEIHGDDYPTINAPDWQTYDGSTVQHIQPDHDLLQALAQHTFLFFLQGQVPQMQCHVRAIGTPEQHDLCTVFLRGDSIATVHHNGKIEVCGSAWDHIERAYARYCQRGAPALEDYHLFTLSQPQRPLLYARIHDEQWSVC